MNIAMVSPYDFAWPGGVNSHVSQLSHELMQRGHEVSVIAPLTPSQSADDTAAAPRFIAMGRTVPLSAAGSKARVTLDARLYPRVRRLMRRQPFDIVHLHEPFAPLLPWLVLQHSRAVNVGTFHAFSENARLYHLGRRAVGRWQRRLHGRIAVSPAARSFVSPHFPGYCYRIIPNGIQYRRFAEARPFPRLRDGRLNILFVGRKDPRKGLRYLLEAFAILQQQRDNVRLIVVGPGKPDRESAGRLAAIAAHDPDAVMLTGAVSAPDLPRYYASADLFCSPATGGESFGIVLLEAMAAGAVVIASNIDGYRDVVAHERDGLLIAPRDPAAIAAAITRVADNPDYARRLAEAGRRAAAQFQWRNVAGKVERYYDQCIEEANRGGNLR